MQTLERSSLRLETDVRASLLVIEDDPSHAEAIARSLEGSAERYRVRFSSTLAEGRLAIAAEPPVLVLCDLNLADGKAFELLAGPQQRAEFPLLVLTSHGDERTAVQSIRAGAIDYVVKSREAFGELPRTIERALREWRLIEERGRLEEQLHHALKMEAIGRLAGGVAHDFNNLLTAIAGYAELLLRGEQPGSPRASGLSEILNATQRASGLTNQLLAFSRKQLIAPVVLDLNALLRRSTRMIQRLIGEDIELSFSPALDLAYVKVDPGQIEQVVVNLAINARDAMPRGGRLRVATRNQRLYDDALPHIDAHAGEYAVLTVEDDGSGMSAETLGRLFEPFFTTKELGRGTGLGLSIIYGVIKQNGGFIVVDSEVGRGSRFELFLPRTEGVPDDADAATRGTGPRGDETVLLVEDDAAVRDVAARFLRSRGYEVIVAMHGSEAVTLARAATRIDLLVTDVILPNVNGRQLFEQLRELHPALSVVFMSGYTDEVIAPHGVLEPGTTFVEKPFSQETLARAAREALDRAAVG